MNFEDGVYDSTQGSATHNIVAEVAAPDHLRRHVLDSAAEWVGAVLLLMGQEFPEKNQNEIIFVY